VLEDETHELPLPRRVHPAPSPTTKREGGEHQHPGSSDQEILRHTIQQQKPRRVKILKDARISLSSGIVDVTIRAPRNQFSAIVKELSEAAGELSEFPHIFPLTNSIKLILPEEDYTLVRGKLEHLKETATQANVSKLILNLSPHAEMTPGIASYITELLFRNGVNILDAFLGYGDIIMVVDDKDGPLAYDVLQREIHGSNTA
jgi:aspartokinase